MNKTVTIPLEEFDKLRNGFEESKLKKQLAKQIDELEQNLKIKDSELQSIISSDFIEVKLRFSAFGFYNHRYYFRKDKTPLWIKRFFN
jgi:hypothetical protein